MDVKDIKVNNVNREACRQCTGNLLCLNRIREWRPFFCVTCKKYFIYYYSSSNALELGVDEAYERATSFALPAGCALTKKRDTTELYRRFRAYVDLLMSRCESNIALGKFHQSTTALDFTDYCCAPCAVKLATKLNTQIDMMINSL